MTFALRERVIYRGEKWLVLAKPLVIARHGLYTLAKPDAHGRISKLSEIEPNAREMDMQKEVLELCV